MGAVVSEGSGCCEAVIFIGGCCGLAGREGFGDIVGCGESVCVTRC